MQEHKNDLPDYSAFHRGRLERIPWVLVIGEEPLELGAAIYAHAVFRTLSSAMNIRICRERIYAFLMSLASLCWAKAHPGRIYAAPTPNFR